MISINMSKEDAARFIEEVKANGGYCPCKIAKVPDNICMCKEFREQESGECHCGLFIKK